MRSESSGATPGAMAPLCLCLVIMLLGCGEPPTATRAPSPVPKRIVSLGPNLTEFCFALGRGSSLVGATAHCDYPEAARSLPRVGRYDVCDLEKLLDLSPDLVLIPEEGLLLSAAEALRALGVAVHPVRVSQVEDLPRVYRELGKLLGVEARGESLAVATQQRIAAVRAGRPTSSGGLPLNAVLIYGADPLCVAGPGSFGHSLLEICGARNAFGEATQAYPRPSWESLIAAQPQVIVNGAMDLAEPAAAHSPLLRFPEIPAVAQNQVFDLHPDLLSRAGPRLVDALESVSVILRQAEARQP